MKSIKDDAELELQLVVTGMHTSPEFGLTYREIEKDGFLISAKVEMLLSSDTPVGIAKSMGLGTIGFADAFSHLKPDLIVVLGDRFEILAAAQTAMAARIPIAHIHGGETTEGVIDEAIRHAITKMSHFHFVSSEDHRRRVIQMGEDPARVFNFGAPGLDNIEKLELMGRAELEESLSFPLRNPTFLVTYHPVTLLPQAAIHAAAVSLLEALDRFPEAGIIFTKANSDTYGRTINEMIDAYVDKNKNRAIAFFSLGQRRYLSTLKLADVVIGNSSSGIIEAPSVPKPSVDIGDRQKGRMRADSILHCIEQTDAIVEAIKKALTPEFLQTVQTSKPLYGKGGNISSKIKDVIKDVNLEAALFKKFWDLPVST
jgi:UDP-N-acetylglucosamine 2-epimerase (non-hydrolysing)/GDP/UDP-N,N'-diacetylbacillosamine 2-epimerase (hydrolysing)